MYDLTSIIQSLFTGTCHVFRFLTETEAMTIMLNARRNDKKMS